MISYTKSNNDIRVFFENNECFKLNDEIIKGIHFNINLKYPLKTGHSECLIKSGLHELMETKIEKDKAGFVKSLVLEILPRVYDKFLDNGRYESHEGFRHIFLLNADYLNFEDEYDYMQLKYLERKPKSLKTISFYKK